MALPTRQLGRDGPQVTALGFGLMGLSSFYGHIDPDEERLKFLDYIYSRGELFWDTSDAYGDSEDLVGKWFRQHPERRADVFLATKFGNLGEGKANNDPEFIRQSCAKSLSRLGTDHLDLYYVHRVDPKVPIEKTIQTLVQLKSEGKIRHFGLSEVSADTLRRAHAVHPIAAVEMEYSPFALEIESSQTNLLHTCKELGVAIVAYSPLGRGMLTGAIQSRADLEEGDWRLTVPRFSEENFPKNMALVRQLGKIAARKGCTPSQLVLAWLMAQWEMVIPIPGTKRQEYFDENIGALDVNLSESEEQEVRTAVQSAEVGGERYPTQWFISLFADTAPLEE